MNFADELRHYHKKSERETITNANLYHPHTYETQRHHIHRSHPFP